ncbi:MAG TPA: mandelate racemase/muconate lactonizing enzyme family protein [Candidatus Acidoferrales bacterium]|jgi:galactonate dehydratase|nr:mandelate racemase/muconate lactonizing enzyme family protein [Candidatus Acidoferrales bacterium]
MRQKIWSHLPTFAPQVPAPQAAAADGLSIATVRGWRLREPSSGRRYTVLRLTTRGGLVGYGEGAPATAADIAEAKAAALGRRPNETEFIRHRLAATPAMEAAVNCAFLDLQGKRTKTPVYQFLGGPTRFKARVLAHLEGQSEDALAAPLQQAVRQGFKAFTVPIPGRDSLWRMQAYVDAVRARVARVRSLVGVDPVGVNLAGADMDFVLDAAGTLTPGDAALLATALEKNRLMWFDEPTSVLTNDGLARIAEESVMPIGLGRSVTDIATFQNLLRWGSIDLLRPSLGLNSISKIKRMAAIAETHYVAVAPYHDGGPIATAAGIHLAASLPNFFIQQIPFPTAERDRAMRAELTSGNQETAKDGFAPLRNLPGFGIEVDERALDRYSEETV